MSKNDKSCHIFNIGLKRLVAKHEKYGTLTFFQRDEKEKITSQIVGVSELCS